jgi:hypothetical protein
MGKSSSSEERGSLMVQGITRLKADPGVLPSRISPGALTRGASN